MEDRDGRLGLEIGAESLALEDWGWKTGVGSGGLAVKDGEWQI